MSIFIIYKLLFQNIGCYMFGIDDFQVVDATMAGNEARFINHSCEPNCYSRIITVDGKKKIMIFAKRRYTIAYILLGFFFVCLFF